VTVGQVEVSTDGAGACSIWHSVKMLPAFALTAIKIFRQDNPHKFRDLNTGLPYTKEEWPIFGRRVDTGGF
jgi:hypothetical protein